MINYDIKNFSFEDTNWVEIFGNFGDGVWWFIGTIISICTLIIICRTYVQQKKEIERLKQDSEELKFQSFFSTVLIGELQRYCKEFTISDIINRVNAHSKSKDFLVQDIYWETAAKDLRKLLILWNNIITLYKFVLNEIKAKNISPDGYKVIIDGIATKEEIEHLEVSLQSLKSYAN